ncbi:LCP family protein [Streptacidiphilus rugosus]|uniref:LCP family protein n=1 Tax=Streptacidiphilus rugosus TaxID=405783 RepID=UPI00068FBE7A|nr:LCP family protein [Streptacidiphilus rugosus]
MRTDRIPAAEATPAAPAAQGRAALRRAGRRGRRRTWKIVGWSLAVVLVLTGGGAVYLYLQLAGNIRTDSSYSGSDRAAAVGVEKADPFGRTPLNIMLLGSDTRSSAADCRLGGACTDAQGARADVEMLVHLSADRSNMTVMSIPRDLMTQLPACTDARTGAHTSGGYGQINSTLQYGPGCTDTAVHKLTGIPIDGFAMVDFAGVIGISQALGGVDLCFTSRFYDRNSGLKLTAGHHVLEGTSALQFLRTRDSFGDGSDNRGRTFATHLFFTAMINRLKGAGTLTDLPAMYRIANAATKSLTVSDNFDTPLKLVDLAGELNKVPTERITFTTMQNSPDPAPHSKHVVAGPGAATLFRAIADDHSLTAGPGGAASTGASATASPAATVQPSTVAVAVSNGSGARGRAAAVLAVLERAGFSHRGTALTEPSPAATTTLDYGPSDAAAAHAVAATLGLPATALRPGSAAGLKLVIGADWTTGTAYPGGHPSAAPLDTAAALAGAQANNGRSAGCVQVSTEYTQPGHTPQMMFDDYPHVPNSAP